MKGPLPNLAQWDDFVEERYRPGRKPEEFRNFTATAPRTVQEFYRQNHAQQTREFVLGKKSEYGPLAKRRMGVWEAMEFLNTLVDDSDPDTNLSQIEHAMQTSEAIRRDGHPRWFILTGLLHDLGKVLCLYGEPQWAVVGDTFPVGCAYSDKIVFPEMFAANPDNGDPQYQTKLGVYEEGCGLRNIDLSWGHDEYLWMVTKRYLPEEAQYMIRYHSCYPIHREGAYSFLMDGHDREMFAHVQAFNPYDLYTKSSGRPDVAALRPYYEDLIAEYFPKQIDW
jgi:inositol oxygenase